MQAEIKETNNQNTIWFWNIQLQLHEEKMLRTYYDHN